MNLGPSAPRPVELEPRPGHEAASLIRNWWIQVNVLVRRNKFGTVTRNCAQVMILTFNIFLQTVLNTLKNPCIQNCHGHFFFNILVALIFETK